MGEWNEPKALWHLLETPHKGVQSLVRDLNGYQSNTSIWEFAGYPAGFRD